jgi:hypothetical protein
MSALSHTQASSFSCFSRPGSAGERASVAYCALITAIALVVIGAIFAKGMMTPGIEYHLSAYLAAGCLVISIIPFAIASALLCRSAPVVAAS